MEQTVDGEIKGIIFLLFSTDCNGVLRSLLLPVRDSIIFLCRIRCIIRYGAMSSDMANPGRIIISVGLLK